jgi:hypothetical protein
MNSLNRVVRVGFAGAMLVALGACGASKATVAKSATTAGKSATTVAAGTASTLAKAAGGVSTTSGAPSTTSASFSGKGGDEFCAFSKAIDEKFNAAADADGTPDSIKKAFADTVVALKQLVGKAPAEIKPDVETLLKAFVGIDGVYAKASYDVSKLSVDPTYASELQKLGTGVDEATSRLEQYSEKVCGEKPTA